jgi:hypothetical protein
VTLVGLAGSVGDLRLNNAIEELGRCDHVKILGSNERARQKSVGYFSKE